MTTPGPSSPRKSTKPIQETTGKTDNNLAKACEKQLDAGIQHYYSIDLVNLNDTHFHQEINELAQNRDYWRMFTEINAMYY